MASSWWAFLYLILSTSESWSSTSRTMAVSMLRLRTGLALWANNDKHGQRYIYFFFFLFILLVNAFVSWPLHGVFVGSRHHRTTFLVVRSHHGCRVHGFSCLQPPPVAVVWSEFVSKQTQSLDQREVWLYWGGTIPNPFSYFLRLHIREVVRTASTTTRPPTAPYRTYCTMSTSGSSTGAFPWNRSKNSVFSLLFSVDVSFTLATI